MPTTTTNYGWQKPTVAGDSGAWGTELNSSLDGIDTTVKSVSNVANAALPVAGGTLTGLVNIKTATMARVDKGSISGAQAFDLSTSDYFTLTLAGAMTMSFSNVPVGTVVTTVTFRIVNGGSAAITWPLGTKWPGGSVATLTAAGTDIVTLTSDDNGATWRGALVAKDVR